MGNGYVTVIGCGGVPGLYGRAVWITAKRRPVQPRLRARGGGEVVSWSVGGDGSGGVWGGLAVWWVCVVGLCGLCWMVCGWAVQLAVGLCA